MKKRYVVSFPKGQYTLSEIIQGLSLSPSRFARCVTLFDLDWYHFYLMREEIAWMKIKYPEMTIFRNGKYY